MLTLDPPVASPFLRWAGSKRKLLPSLVPYWLASGACRYLEPFVGSGALFFALGPAEAVLSDLNSDLIETYRAIAHTPNAVSRALANLPRSRATFLRLRGDQRALSPSGRAARFIYLNRHCFNGLYRTNSAGQFNVPYAPAKAGAVPNRVRLRAIAALLQGAKLAAGDFEGVTAHHVRPGDFVYLDPPYAVANRRIFRQYNGTTFGFEDLSRLSDLLHAIDALGATFVLSYAYCREALEAFRSWPHKRVLIQRNIAGFAASRRRSSEMIISNISP